jgi:hypothetical protein
MQSRPPPTGQTTPWAKSFDASATKITQSCKVAYPYDAATVCRWMPGCDSYFVMLAEGVMNGMTDCDKAWKKCGATK